MNPVTGEMVGIVARPEDCTAGDAHRHLMETVTTEEATRRGCTVPVPDEEVERLRAMNRKQRRAWARANRHAQRTAV